MRDASEGGPPATPDGPAGQPTPSSPPRAVGLRWTRRRILEAAAGALVLGGAALGVARTSGYAAPGRPLVVLTAWQYAVIEQAARRITAPDRPGDPAVPSADDVGVAAFADGWMSRMPRRLRRDLGRFLGYVEHVAPLRAGFGSRFTRLSSSAQDRVLTSLESSSSDLLRAGFEGLRSLVFLGYYRDARTWKIVGYDGPLVGRPAGGW